jgi:hypothetical protein
VAPVFYLLSRLLVFERREPACRRATSAVFSAIVGEGGREGDREREKERDGFCVKCLASSRN